MQLETSQSAVSRYRSLTSVPNIPRAEIAPLKPSFVKGLAMNVGVTSLFAPCTVTPQLPAGVQTSLDKNGPSGQNGTAPSSGAAFPGRYGGIRAAWLATGVNWVFSQVWCGMGHTSSHCVCIGSSTCSLYQQVQQTTHSCAHALP